MPLHDAVGLGSDNARERAALMLSENKDLVIQREELSKKKLRLENAKKSLSSFSSMAR